MQNKNSFKHSDRKHVLRAIIDNRLDQKRDTIGCHYNQCHKNLFIQISNLLSHLHSVVLYIETINVSVQNKKDIKARITSYQHCDRHILQIINR